MSERDSGGAERVRIELRELGILQAEVRENKLGERVEAALNAYHHALPYMVQKKALVEAFEAYEAKLFSEEAIERTAKVLHPEAWDEGRLAFVPFRSTRPEVMAQERSAAIREARTVVAALRGEA